MGSSLMELSVEDKQEISDVIDGLRAPNTMRDYDDVNMNENIWNRMSRLRKEQENAMDRVLCKAFKAPKHVNCRSTVVPMVKNFRKIYKQENGFDIGIKDAVKLLGCDEKPSESAGEQKSEDIYDYSMDLTRGL